MIPQLVERLSARALEQGGSLQISDLATSTQGSSGRQQTQGRVSLSNPVALGRKEIRRGIMRSMVLLAAAAAATISLSVSSTSTSAAVRIVGDYGGQIGPYLEQFA